MFKLYVKWNGEFFVSKRAKYVKIVKNFEKKIKYGNFMEVKIPEFRTGIL